MIFENSDDEIHIDYLPSLSDHVSTMGDISLPTYTVEILNPDSSNFTIISNSDFIFSSYNFLNFYILEKLNGTKSQELVSIRVTASDNTGTATQDYEIAIC
jgi:hypothetical protein